MNSALQRGVILMNQGRNDLAEKEFRQSLADDPESFLGHAYFSLCLSNLDKDAEALRIADEAVRIEPDLSLGHFVRSRALIGLKRFREAESSAKEAVRLDPTDADSHVLLGEVAIARQNPTEALEAANQALQFDGQHINARNIRALALTQLGRKEEAAQTLGEALAEDPEDAVSHANQGWVCLHANDHAKALEHFREALRLQPELEWARVGIIEALKSRYLIYRLMLRFFLWIGRQTQVAQWGIVLAIVAGPQLLRSLANSAPGFAPLFSLLLVLAFGFVLMTWVASPLFNFLLRFNKFGRLALTAEEKRESSWIGGFTLIALAFTVAHFATGASIGRPFFGMRIFGFMLFPIRVTYMVSAGRPRQIAATIAIGLFLLNVPFLSILCLDNLSPFRNPTQAANLFLYGQIGMIASSWLPMILRTRDSFR